MITKSINEPLIMSSGKVLLPSVASKGEREREREFRVPLNNGFVIAKKTNSFSSYRRSNVIDIHSMIRSNRPHHRIPDRYTLHATNVWAATASAAAEPRPATHGDRSLVSALNVVGGASNASPVN
jgi:hypothetical protein